MGVQRTVSAIYKCVAADALQVLQAENNALTTQKHQNLQEQETTTIQQPSEVLESEQGRASKGGSLGWKECGRKGVWGWGWVRMRVGE